MIRFSIISLIFLIILFLCLKLLLHILYFAFYIKINIKLSDVFVFFLINLKKLNKKFPIIYACSGFEGVAIRFRQQLNENAKVLVSHNVIPEMNHNELVGWTEKGKYAVVIIRNEVDYERNQMRIAINKEIITKYAKTIIEIKSKGESLIENTLYLIHLTDWVSFYLAEIRSVDAVEVKVIDFLKGELGK